MVQFIPSFEYANQVWEALIRDCYGSVAITAEVNEVGHEKLFTSNLNKIKRNGQNPISMLRNALNKTKQDITDNIKERFEDLMEVSFSEKIDIDSNINGYSSKILTSDPEGYKGQVISESGYHHLVSIVKKDSFDPERWRSANLMRNLAKEQDKFKL